MEAFLISVGTISIAEVGDRTQLLSLVLSARYRRPLPISAAGAFAATLTSFFVAEIGDKTQIATLALAAAYPHLWAVVAGTTLGMLVANIPVVILGKAFADRLPLKAIHYAASALFVVLGALFLARALWH